jgi:hypothetical protein
MARRPAQPEAIDVALRVLDRRLPVGPGETDFKQRECNTIDNERLSVGTPDSGMPQASSSLEALDGEVFIETGHFGVPKTSFDTRKNHKPAEPNVNRIT